MISERAKSSTRPSTTAQPDSAHVGLARANAAHATEHAAFPASFSRLAERCALAGADEGLRAAGLWVAQNVGQGQMAPARVDCRSMAAPKAARPRASSDPPLQINRFWVRRHVAM